MNWRGLKHIDKKIAVIAIALIAVVFIGIPSYAYYKKLKENDAKINTLEILKVEENGLVSEEPLAQPEAKEKVAKDPPKTSGSKGKVSTSANADGSSTTTMSEGGISLSEQQQIASQGPSGSSIDTIEIVDETGQNSALIPILREYWKGLKIGGEISRLYQLTIRNAGASGWEGQYAGSYTMDGGGNITSAFGYIVLNTYYHQTDPHFNDYMKLVLSHEYGHHYTLYHKWMTWNFSQEVRFPDSYYSTRPLSKSNTAIDYSLGWANCEAEIIAEDYSYIYSGYGYHAMAATRGYPSGTMSGWFNSFAAGPGGGSPESDDNPPTVSISSPANGATVSGIVSFSASASDDKGVTKVGFYINSTLLSEDSSAPYSISLNTGDYSNGAYSLKAIAYDASQTAEVTISITISNADPTDTEDPTVTIIEPAANPYAWTASVPTLSIKVRTNDNIGVTRIRIYIDDELQGEYLTNGLNLGWNYAGTPTGEYIFRAEGYDAAGNKGEATLTINKT